MVELSLQNLIGKVDAQLLEAVGGHYLKPEDVQDTNEGHDILFVTFSESISINTRHSAIIRAPAMLVTRSFPRLRVLLLGFIVCTRDLLDMAAVDGTNDP